LRAREEGGRIGFLPPRFYKNSFRYICQSKSPDGTRDVTLEDLRLSASHRIMTSRRFGAGGRFKRAYIHAGERVLTTRSTEEVVSFMPLVGKRKSGQFSGST